MESESSEIRMKSEWRTSSTNQSWSRIYRNYINKCRATTTSLYGNSRRRRLSLLAFGERNK